MHTTLAQLRSLKLDGLASGLEEQRAQPGMTALSFEERVAPLIDHEVHARNDRKLVRLLKNVHLKYGRPPSASGCCNWAKPTSWCSTTGAWAPSTA
jgi:hypothetical protein